MKVKLNLKKIVSYLLIFTILFSTIQLGSIKIAEATDTTFIDTIVLKADDEEIVVDKKGNRYVAEYINMGTKSFTIEGEGDWKVQDAKSSNSKMSVTSSTVNGGKKFTFSNITNYSDFTFTVKVKNSVTNAEKEYTIYMSFEIESLLQFKQIRVSDANNLANFSNIGFDEREDDGTYRTYVEEDVTTAKVELIDSKLDVMTTGVKINGSSGNTVKLTSGDNAVSITVTRNNTTKEYILIITKKGQPALKSLVPSTGKLSPTFKSDVYDYTIDVPTTLTSIAFTPTAIDSGSTIRVNGTVVKSGKKSQEIKLREGSNNVTIVITTKENETATYSVEVVRAEEFRSSALKSLKLSKGTLNPSFNKGIYDYTTTVDNSVTSITVTPVAEDVNATITVDGKKLPSGAVSPYINLDEGANVINVKVTDTDGDSSTYSINVTRRYGKDNVNLSSLSVTDGTMSPKFDPETYLYSVKVDRNIEKVRIKFNAKNDKATVKIGGKSYTNGQDSDYINLSIGANLVVVEVVSEDKKTTTTYKLSIIRGQIEGTNQWVLVSGNWTFYNGAGVQVKNQWVKYDNEWYFLDVNGYMKTGWLLESGNWYYLNTNGIMQTGWFYEKGYWYYLEENGAMKINSWGQYDGNWYLFNGLGEMQTGWTLYGPYWYYMNEKGIMQKGWITYNKNKYYLNDDGSMRNGWLYTGSVWYFLDNSGVMKTGWQTINGKKYYFDANGVMKTGMLFLDGKWINLNNI